MELYLHIGTNKTGSSFLQSSLALNKAFLAQNGFYLVPSKWDDEMIRSKITPGNGHQLAVLLAAEDEKQLLQYFETFVSEARSKGLHKIIISNEILVRLLSNSQLVGILSKVATQAGISKVRVLLVLRNIFEHALSLYKHRAKYGDHSDYKN